MLKKRMKYIDFDNNEREEDFYFNLTKAELTQMELSKNGGFGTMIHKIISEQEQFEEARLKFTAKTQPRDYTGKFRKVLARLKTDLGDQASEQLARKMEEAEAAGAIGNYAAAKDAGQEVVKLLDDVKQGDLKKGTIDNIRKGSRDLGKLLAYLPLPQGDTSQKVRFSDLPGPTSKLIQDLIKRVDTKLDNEDAAKYTNILKEFMSGVRMMSSDEMSRELARVLRVLA